jgi:AraC family transcriptional regulator, arabinose operon regulatory protein
MSTTMDPLRDAPFSLLAGGLHHCDPAWNKPTTGIDQCYKLYYPVRGHARLTLDTEEAPLRPGVLYLIPGYHLVRQECQRRMDVYWLHFVPESLDLTFQLSHVTRVHAWPRDVPSYWRATCREIPRLFDGGGRGLFYRVQAMLMDVAGRALEADPQGALATVDPTLEQLQPAIAYMDQHWAKNPRLAEIARTVHLAPNYFHRKFTGAFRITPFHYMLRRRLNLGRQLLLSTDLPLDHVAEQCGFYSAFHFSKLFKKHCGLSPKQFRTRALP